MKNSLGFLSKIESYDLKLHDLDPDGACEGCKGPISYGELRAAGICSDCYFESFEDEDDETV